MSLVELTLLESINNREEGVLVYREYIYTLKICKSINYNYEILSMILLFSTNNYVKRISDCDG